ncbi:hypothetical protein [Glaciimonas sp. PCH181]|uniref:hypothetical protein n=1 Tax=Glaciimonas sp. PCH181 TaxID=2133943 RepID=UPI001374A1F7|nr:hypothetical protein [Glaciimonas sp. PCH181]
MQHQNEKITEGLCHLAFQIFAFGEVTQIDLAAECLGLNDAITQMHDGGGVLTSI